MNHSDSQHDPLQKLWREENSFQEDFSMLSSVLKEKRQSFEELIAEQNKGEYTFGLPWAVITALCAWRATPGLIQFGFAGLTVTLLAASAITWWSGRRESSVPDPSLNLRDYHLALVALYDRRIRLLKSVKFWYGIPLLAGGGLVLLPAATRYFPSPWGGLLLGLALTGAWIGIWHMNDIRGVSGIEAKKAQVDELLSRLGEDR